MTTVLGVLGATGVTGSLLVQYGLEREHQVVGLARFPWKLPGDHLDAISSGKLRIVKGDARDEAALEEVVKSTDVIFEATGHNHNRPGTMREDIAKLLVKLMRKHGKKRLLYISAAFAHEEGLVVVPQRMRGMVAFMSDNKGADVLKAEEVYRAAGSWLEWTVIQPPRIVQKPLTEDLITKAGKFPQAQNGSFTITFADMALMMLDTAANGTFIHQDVYLNCPSKLSPGLKDIPKFADMMITNLGNALRRCKRRPSAP
ncbi:hypothetical protein WJX73_002630 [Symbiochloris irregularis]|uniref:NAD(P)-binding domain-containing protein n=1 Tax=Symbiochloris irregularis TaxID=706552 RepID=A0AAW1NIY8_9CHLO